jgi:hypothetical protein
MHITNPSSSTIDDFMWCPHLVMNKMSPKFVTLSQYASFLNVMYPLLKSFSKEGS